MKYWIVALVLVVGCGTEPEQLEEEVDSKYPFTIGTWRVDAADQATWIGKEEAPNSEAQKKVSKTTPEIIHVDNPLDHNVSIQKYDEGRHGFGFRFIYVDSTMTPSFFQTTEGSPQHTGFEAPLPTFGGGTVIHDEYFGITRTVTYDCEHDYELEDEFFIFNLNTEDDEPFRSYHFDAEGLIATIEYVVCEN